MEELVASEVRVYDRESPFSCQGQIFGHDWPLVSWGYSTISAFRGLGAALGSAQLACENHDRDQLGSLELLAKAWSGPADA
jgi:hypothetical protein